VRALLVAVELLSASVWLGGLVAIPLVGRIVRAQLEPAARVEFFRVLGRRYLAVGGGSLVVALACGAALLARGGWTNAKTVAVALAGALLVTVGAGVMQARALTRARREALETGDPGAGQLGLRASTAAVLRIGIAALSVALVALAARLAG
jgi:hypothetical protein